jgi:hypothetical protein
VHSTVRPDHQQVLPGQQTHQRAVDQLGALEELLAQLVTDGAQKVPGRRHAGRIGLAITSSQPLAFA